MTAPNSPPTDADKQQLIHVLRFVSTGENMKTSIYVDEVLRYFTVQVFVVNIYSYIGKTGHSYFLYEEDGVCRSWLEKKKATI